MNKALASLVAKKLGVPHTPGQVYCNIHPVLMFDNKMKEVWEEVEKIDAKKLFPPLSHCNLDLNSLIGSVQCVDAMMSLVSPDKSNRSWRKFFE